MSYFSDRLAKHTVGNSRQISKKRIFLAFKKPLQILIDQANLHGIRWRIAHSSLVQ